MAAKLPLVGAGRTSSRHPVRPTEGRLVRPPPNPCPYSGVQKLESCRVGPVATQLTDAYGAQHRNGRSRVQDTAGRGIQAFISEVIQRGGRAERLEHLPRNPVQVWGVDGNSCIVRVRAKIDGDWQARRQDALPDADDTGSQFWVFVDLGSTPVTYFVLPSDEVAAGIAAEVDIWMADARGRTRTGSHAIPLSSVAHGKDRWDLLGLTPAKDTTATPTTTRPRPSRSGSPATARARRAPRARHAGRPNPRSPRTRGCRCSPTGTATGSRGGSTPPPASSRSRPVRWRADGFPIDHRRRRRRQLPQR